MNMDWRLAGIQAAGQQQKHSQLKKYLWKARQGKAWMHEEYLRYAPVC
jgi:hypothetical protein